MSLYFVTSLAALRSITVGPGNQAPLDTVCLLLYTEFGNTSYKTGAYAFILRESPGAVDNSYSVIVPSSSPGNFWWENIPFGLPRKALVPVVTDYTTPIQTLIKDPLGQTQTPPMNSHPDHKSMELLRIP